MAYTLLAERTDHLVYAAVAAGAEVNVDDAREALDTWLGSPLVGKGLSAKESELRAAIGLEG